MTEDEAVKRWCPFARVQTYASDHMVAANRDVDGRKHPYALCIGSACMAWRWASGSEPATIEHAVAAGYSTDDPRGFCGLAGAPQ